jgi:predicted adenine nucleotide alpha hydrolase (AANH) superfamily ATPase
LSISPYKNSAVINKVGREIADKYEIRFLEKDFKADDGFGKSCRLSKELGLYRQNYCGCEFSIRLKL